MNFVAGSLLLACATRDPAVGAPCYPTCDRRRSVRGDSSSSVVDGDGGSGGGGGGGGGGGDVSPFVATAASMALSPTSASAWEEWDDFDGSGEDESQPEWRSGPAHLRAEKDVFWLMLALTSRLSGVGSGLGMRELWLPGVPQLKVRVFQFDKLMLRELPRLYNHFKAKQLQLEGWGGLGGAPRSAGGGKGEEKALPRQCSSVRLLRETADVKLTRSTLNSLQQDFAVQLLKEHLQGEGQWLTRYGDAPDPTPGAGAGVVGGDRDGDVGFMGVEAMTRMMLSDTKLLKKLKESLAKMAAPLQEDARIFQNKITEASERLEEATRERTSLSSELLRLKEDIDALGQRKKLVADQMHLLLVQFERDSAVYTPEGTVAGEEAADGSSSRQGNQGGRGDVGEVAVVSLSPTSSAAGSAGGFVHEFKDDGGVGEGGVESDVVSFFSGGGGRGVVDIIGGPVATTSSSGDGGGGVVGINGGTVATTSSSGGGGGDETGTAGGGIVVEPMDDGRAVGEHDLAAAGAASAAGAGAARAAAAAMSGGGTSEGEYTTGRNNNNNNNNNDSDDDRCSSSIRSRSSSGCCEGDSTDDDGPLDGRTHQQEHAPGLRGAPAAAAAGAGADGTPFTVASKHEDPGDASSGSPAAITLPRGPLGGKNTEMV
ncbi:unnamed protein product, partial [Ectocarpus sp. 12 AP-2014]